METNIMYKTMFITAIAFFMLTLSTFAQQKMTPQERVKAMTERLSLTKDQAAQIEKIIIQQQDQIKKMRSEGKPDRTAMKKMRDENQAQIEKVLDDKQKVEFKKMQDEMKQEKKNMKSDNKTDTQKDDK
jgi:hypothetical protein